MSAYEKSPLFYAQMLTATKGLIIAVPVGEPMLLMAVTVMTMGAFCYRAASSE